MRPKRVYKTKRGKYYYLRKGKRVYIRGKKGEPKLSQRQVLNVSIKNIIGDKSRRVKRRRKRKKIGYTKKIIEEQTPVKTGLPVYLFEPKKTIPSLTERVSVKAKNESTSSYDTILKSIGELRKMISIPDDETKTKTVSTAISDEDKNPKPEIKYNKTTLKKLIKKKLIDSNIDRTTADNIIDDLKPAGYSDKVIKELFEYKNVSLESKDKFKELYNIIEKLPPDDVFAELTGIIYLSLEDNEKTKLPTLSPQEKTLINQDDQQMPASEIEGSGNGDGEDGLYNGEIEKINKKVFPTTVPVIAKNELDTLDEYVKPNMDKFGFIINTDPVPQPKNSNGHWRAVYINNCDDYQSIEYFDPLVSTPEKELILKLRQIAKKINPEQFFLFKINNLKTQPDESDNCGYHCILFLEKRFHNVPWSEATYYNDYMNRVKPEHSNKGEVEVIKAKKKYKTYL